MVHMLVPIEQTRWHTLYDTDYNVTRVWLRAPQDYIDVSNLAPLDQQPGRNLCATTIQSPNCPINFCAYNSVCGRI